jgi:hypothetical protein
MSSVKRSEETIDYARELTNSSSSVRLRGAPAERQTKFYEVIAYSDEEFRCE